MPHPLVFFHGVTRRGASVDPLRPFFEILHAPDFPGHGRAGRRPGFYRVADQADWATAYLDALPESRVVLWGHSMGAMVAAAAASRLPGKVAAVILEDPPFETMGRRLAASGLADYFGLVRSVAGDPRPVPELARALADLRYGNGIRLGDTRDATALRFNAVSWKALDPAVLDPVLDGSWLHGYTGGPISSPVLLLQADPAHGGMLTDEDAQAFAAGQPDCTVVRVPGAPHLIHWADTAAAVRLASGFLSSLNALY